MNKNPGVIGRKVGMTQIFLEDGTVVPCTVIEAAPVVAGKRTEEKDGYTALILAYGERKEKGTNKPLAGFYQKAGLAPHRLIKEFRCSAEYAAKWEVGQTIGVGDVFTEGQFVDVQGLSKGHGFTGVMVRHNFKGAKQTHGAHEYHRHGGSIGTNMTPGRTMPGMKMPGQHGNHTSSVLNQKVVKLLPEQGLVLVHGGVPGSRNSFVLVRGAVKKLSAG